MYLAVTVSDHKPPFLSDVEFCLHVFVPLSCQGLSNNVVNKVVLISFPITANLHLPSAPAAAVVHFKRDGSCFQGSSLSIRCFSPWSRRRVFADL